MNTKELEQALIDYAINSVSSEEVAQVLNVDASAIQSALKDFNDEWNEAEEPEDADAVIDKWVEFFTSDAKVEDVMLSKHGYNDDYLTWTYMGKEYWAEGEFHVDDSGELHHTFNAPNGKEIEIVTPYNN